MRVKYIGNVPGFYGLLSNKIYNCIGIEKGWYRIIDESGEDYLYPPEVIEPVDAKLSATQSVSYTKSSRPSKN